MMFQANIRLIFLTDFFNRCHVMMAHGYVLWASFANYRGKLSLLFITLMGLLLSLILVPNSFANEASSVSPIVTTTPTHSRDHELVATTSNSSNREAAPRHLLQLNVLAVNEQWVDNKKAIVITFSQDLSPKLNVNRFITVTQNKKAAKGEWQRLAEHTNSLYFAPIAPKQHYEIFIRPGLKSNKGLQLLKPQTFQITSEASTPSMNFAAQGLSLSPAQYGRLALQSTGIKQLDVRLFKLDAKQDEAFADYLRANPQANMWQIETMPFLDHAILQKNYTYDAKPQTRQQSLLVWDTLSAAKRQQTDNPATTSTDNQQQGEQQNHTLNGLYVLHVKTQTNPDFVTHDPATSQIHPQEQDYVYWFNLSDVMLSTQQSGDEVLINFFSQQSGKVLPDLDIEVTQNEQQKSYTTDHLGQIRIKQQTNTSQLMVRYRHQGHHHLQFIALHPTAQQTTEPTIAMNDHAVLFLDKPNYTHNDTIKLSALAIKNNQLLTRKPLEIRLRRDHARSVSTPKANYIYRKQVMTDEQGLLRLDYAVGNTIDYGNWLFEIALPNQPIPLTSQRFSIWSNQQADFRLALQTPSTTITPEQSVILQADAQSSGNELSHANAHVKLQRMIHLARKPFAYNTHQASSDVTQFAYLQDYVFGNPDDQHLSGQEDLPDLSLSAKGKAHTKLAAVNNHISSPLLFTYQGKLTINHTTVAQTQTQQVLWPDDNLIGIRALFSPAKLAPKQGASFSLIRVNRNGERSAVKRVQTRLIKRDSFLGSSITVAKRSINLHKTKPNELVFPVDEGGDYRLEVLDPKTDLVTSYDFVIHDQQIANNEDETPTAADSDTHHAHHDNFYLQLDKAHYQQGDGVQLNIKGRVGSDVLVSLESDQRLWQEKVQLHDQKTHRLTIPLDKTLFAKLSTNSDNGASSETAAMHELTITVTGFQREQTTTQWQRLSASMPLFIIPKPTIKNCELDPQDNGLLCHLPERKSQYGWVVLTPIFAPSAHHATHTSVNIHTMREKLRPILFGASGWTKIALGDWLQANNQHDQLLGLTAQLYMPQDKAWQTLQFMLPSLTKKPQ
jgi:uncharacterized protein YfaS (alpha-2-macroglobulin family)